MRLKNLDLAEMICHFEDAFPRREWVIARREGLRYLATSTPAGFIHQVGMPTPDLIKAIGETPELAFEAMMLRTMRRYNVKQDS